MADRFRFLWIMACFLLSFSGGVPLAAGLTLCADFFLIFTPYYAPGMALFLIVQLVYIQSLRHMPFYRRFIFALPFLCFFPLPLLGGAYALLFLFHFFLAIKKAGTRRNASAILYALALVLFAACDITVAWGYFSEPRPELVWLFYAPSQLLLALTARPWQPPQPFFRPRKGRKGLPFPPAKP